MILSADDPFCGTVLTDNEVALLNHDGIRAQLSSLRIAHNPVWFASSITERTHASHAAMVMGSTTIDDSGCELFFESASSQFESAFSTLAGVTAGPSRGVSAEHLAKVWMIPHAEAACTLQVTTQCLCTDIDSSLSRNIGEEQPCSQVLPHQVVFLYRHTFCHQHRKKITRQYLCTIICLGQRICCNLSHATSRKLFFGPQAVC